MLKNKIKTLMDENETLKRDIKSLNDKVQARDVIIERLRMESITRDVVCAFQDINSYFELEKNSTPPVANKLERFRIMLRNRQSHYLYIDKKNPAISDDENTILYKLNYLYNNVIKFDDKTTKHITRTVGISVYKRIIEQLENHDYNNLKIDDVDPDTIYELESKFI